MSFLDYMFEIWTVGTVNKIDVGIAFLQFKADVVNGYDGLNTGGALPDFDFVTLKAAWDAMTPDEQQAACAEWDDFTFNHYHEACALYVALTEED